MNTKLALPRLTDLGNGRIGNVNDLVDIDVRNVTDGDNGDQHGVVDYEGWTYRVRRNVHSCNKNCFIYQTVSRPRKGTK